MKYPFEVQIEEIQANSEDYVSVIFSSLQSEFLVLPKGLGFIEYAVFETGYEAIKQATSAFTDLSSASLLQLVSQKPICIIVLRTILGFTPPEWAYIATQQMGVEVTQGFARALDRRIRLEPLKVLGKGAVAEKRVK
ncbi:MAG: hypothetical protein ACREOB_06805, partial [Thermodesulfobacteriota bacterium]